MKVLTLVTASALPTASSELVRFARLRRYGLSEAHRRLVAALAFGEPADLVAFPAVASDDLFTQGAQH